MPITIKISTLYTGSQVLFDQVVELDGKYVVSFADAADYPAAGINYDFSGSSMAPAFIDLQLYGASGKLFNNVQDLETLAAIHALNLPGGTTRYLVTIPTSSADTIYKAIDIVREGLRLKLPGLLGLHLEGPFINAEKRGAHIEEFVRHPDEPEFEKIIAYGRGVVKMMTVAPEFFTAAQLHSLLEAEVIIAAGHSNASYEQANTSFNQGVKLATHLYNAMSPLGSREPGLTGAVLNHPDIHASIIADGVHCSFASLQLAYKLMGSRLFLITDSVTASDQGPYTFFEAGDRYVTASGTLAGSALSMISAVKNCTLKCGIPMPDSLRMASTLPAAIMGLQHLGQIKPGALADLVIFDANVQIQGVFYEGAYLHRPE